MTGGQSCALPICQGKALRALWKPGHSPGPPAHRSIRLRPEAAKSAGSSSPKKPPIFPAAVIAGRSAGQRGRDAAPDFLDAFAIQARIARQADAARRQRSCHRDGIAAEPAVGDLLMDAAAPPTAAPTEIGRAHV